MFNGIELKSIAWWYWLFTALSLSFGVTGKAIGFEIAMALTVWQLFYFWVINKQLKAFPVQAR